MDSHNYQILALPDPEALAAEAARRFVSLAVYAIVTHGRFSVALSGGGTPEAMHRLLAQAPLKNQVTWENVHVFWGDERFVPPDDPDSSQRMARETLLNNVPIPAANIYPMPTVGLTPDAAAQQYARTISNFFAPFAPRFDLVFLGMGADGHTASLFPGQTAVTTSHEQLVTAVFHAPKPPPIRLTLTYQAINQAANIIFLVSGSSKADMIARIFAPERDPVRYPAQGVRPGNGRLLWLLDNEAAQKLADTLP
ncbi:MAG: 6-phosphogluconolactonase [Anaerolinea sp.]|nr:6-phosphogluconolactonase [Anaerolinea sp.]